MAEPDVIAALVAALAGDAATTALVGDAIFGGELPEGIAALRGAGLPEPGAGRYFAAHEHGGIAGYVGLEGEGQDLLLRSLVVLADLKAQGIGSRILTAVEAMASDLGSERLHLLTTTAELFFARRAFVSAERASAPLAIRQTREFADVCPASAAYLIKDL